MLQNTLRKLVTAGLATLMLLTMIGSFALASLHASTPPDDKRQRFESDISNLQFGSPEERVKTLETISQHAIFGAEVIQKLGQPLLNDKDAKIRLSVAKSFVALVNGSNKQQPNCKQFQPQMVDFLTAAFMREQDQAVKVAIVESLAYFDVPEAVDLLNRAATDASSDVRNAAQQAKITRERRLFFSLCN